MASKKITEMTVATGLEDTDILTGVDNSAGVADKNVQITKANLGFAADDDPRLSDSRDPNTHASTHGDGSTDPVSIKSSQVTDFQTTVSENPTVVENTKKVGGPAGGVSDAELSLFDGTSGKLIRGGSAIEAASYTFGTIPGGVLTNLRGNEAVGLFARGSDGTLQDAIGLTTYVYVDGVAPTDGLVLLRGINVHLDGLTSTKLLVNGVDKLTVDGSLITAADPVVLPADPTTDLQATTKQYVDGTSVPAGGTTDQVLAKASNLDHALKWAAPGTGGTAPDLSQWDMAGRLSVDPGPYESVNPTTLGAGQWNASISLLGWNAAGQLKKFGPSVYEQYDVAMRLSSGDGRVEPSGVADLLPAASVAALTYALVWKPDGSLGVVDLNTIGDGSGADTKVGVSATDTTPDYLQEKLTSGDASVSITRINAGADEQLDIRATGEGGAAIPPKPVGAPDGTSLQIISDVIVWVSPDGTIL